MAAASRVLLIEDDPTMLKLLSILLDIEGYEILPLEDDSEAGILDTLRLSQPDMVMMDVNLRKANGLDVLQRIRQQDEFKGIRILMSSGMDYRIECLQAGADHFLQKPFMPDELVEIVHRILDPKT